MVADKFGIAGILFFSAISLFLYMRPFLTHYSTFYAFVILLATSIIGMKVLNGSILYFPGIIGYSFIFYLLLGVKDFSLVKRSRLYYIAALLLFYSIFIEFFLADKSELFLLKYGMVIVAAFFLFREWLIIIKVFSFPKRELIVSAVAAFLLAQVLWAAALLPIGFISASNFMLLFVFVAADFLVQHFLGGISKEFLIQRFVFFALVSALIFWTSNWSLRMF